ncbi:transcriptional regulator [Aggregatibacter actinomycetemcomitans D17P-3]|nr:S24 family peptidase [Aggregatibacter actinomycetemcomitans]KOE31992.1 transcriptional regulator [Aggregatibacter actinomycetemcomitans D17P-3]KOE61949.1 transcriptional regulator [Aggregatibacter actinomycetemcomitans serotype c str. D17P-2]
MRVKFKNNSSIGSRIRELREQKKISRNAMAENLGLSLSALQNWETSQTEPIASMIITLAEELGVEPSYLLTGEKNGDVGSPPIKRAQTHEISGVSMIDCFCSVNVSAGFGSFNEGVTAPDGQVPYSDSLLQKLGIKPTHAAVFWADGTSMRPTIDDGDQMLVDLSKKEIKGDKIYLVQNRESVWVKRVKLNWNGIELISDNKEEYAPITLTKEEADKLEIIGQVAYIGKSVI